MVATRSGVDVTLGVMARRSDTVYYCGYFDLLEASSSVLRMHEDEVDERRWPVRWENSLDCKLDYSLT